MEVMETKVKFRDEFKKFVSEIKEVDIDRLTPIKQSKAMAEFYLQKIQKVITPALVPTDEDDFENCVIDGSDDCGVDFLYRSDGIVLLIQAKYRGFGKNEKPDDVTHFCEVLKRLHPATGAKYPKNAKLKEAIADIDWDDDFFNLQYITLGRIGSGVRARIEEGPTLGSGLESLEDRWELSASDESDLNAKLREALSSGETIAQPLAIRFIPDGDGVPWLKLESGGKRNTYTGFVSGSEIAELYKPNRFRLFAMNIRDWIGDTSTNKGIVSTAENRPDDFLFFNNGISAVATGVEEFPDSNTLQCRNFSIINGAQTVRSLFKAHSNNPSSLKRTRVAVRISTISLGKEPLFVEEVTRYNNTQNKVSVSDFRSNDPIQRELADRFEKMKRGGQQFWYKNKRSREKRDKIPIEMEEFAKAVHAFRFGPHDMFGGTARLFDTSQEGRYSLVYGDGETVWITMSDEDFLLLSGIWFLCEEIRLVWKENKKQRAKDDAGGKGLERRYMVYYAVGELLRMIYQQKGKDLNVDLRKLGNPKWTERTGVEKETLRELTELAFTGLVKAYETASRPKDFRHRNWFRDKENLDAIATDLRFIRDIKFSGKDQLPLLLGNS
jgi:hypothetical protein